MINVAREIGQIILETPPLSVEDVVDLDMSSHISRLLQIAEAARGIDRQNLKWVMPTATGIKWQTTDGRTHERDLE